MLRDPAGAAAGHGEPPLAGEPEPIEHPVKFYEKGDRPLEFVSTRQWFVRLLDRKRELIDAGERVGWHPDFMRLRFRNWTENLQLDWCISRQRYFGVPFPVWYPLLEDGTPDHSRPILADEASLPVDPLTDVAPGYEKSQRDRPGGFTRRGDRFGSRCRSGGDCRWSRSRAPDRSGSAEARGAPGQSTIPLHLDRRGSVGCAERLGGFRRIRSRPGEGSPD